MPENSAPSVERRSLRAKPFSKADRRFYKTATVAANSSIVLVSLIFVFLMFRSWPAFESQGIAYIFGSTWDNSPDNFVLQIGPMLWGSVLVSAVGVVLAVPMAISIAYFIVFMANKRFGKIATVMIDLLAALPSVVLGLWGLLVFSPVAAGWAEMLNEYLGFIPIFQNSSGNFLRSPFIASWVVAVMIVPIIASVTREIFSQLDRELINASLALGAGRWSTFRRVIMPTSSGGVVGGILLGLGRALGETVAIFFVLNLVFDINWVNVLEDKGGSVASMILAKFGEAGQEEVAGLMAAGVVLFVVTLFVNMVASYIVSKAQPWRK
ncbi:MAG: phosphate ABC transporter permease subunit PstC [Rhodoluna sp.]|nr:phosphate ABC transporter permease subunit PstC [Rhodoluna sp.]